MPTPSAAYPHSGHTTDFGGASSWDDIRPALEDALANAIFTELFDITENDFTQAIQDAVAERETAGNRT